MSIEGGPSGAIAGTVFEAAPVVPSGIINEGPFRGSLEGFRSMNITDIKTIADASRGGTIGPSVEAKLTSGGSTALARIEPVLNKQDIIEETEHWLGIKKVTSESNYNLSSYGIITAEEGRGINLAKAAGVHTRLLVQPKSKINEEDIIEGTFRVLEESPRDQPKAGIAVLNHTQNETKYSKAQTVSASEARQKRAEQIIWEEEVLRKRHLVDKVTLSKRISGISEAFKKAKEFSGSFKISKGLINKFWAGERDPENIAQAARPGPDGSIHEIREVFDSQEFDSEQDAIGVVKGKRPVKEGKINEDGEEATEEDKRRVFKFHLFKPAAAFEFVKKRVAKKLVPEPLMENNVPNKETRIEDYPDLAEVFK